MQDLLGTNQGGMFARMPLMQHRGAILDPLDIETHEASAADQVAVHRAPPCEVLVVPSNREKERTAGRLNPTRTRRGSQPREGTQSIEGRQQ